MFLLLRSRRDLTVQSDNFTGEVVGIVVTICSHRKVAVPIITWSKDRSNGSRGQSDLVGIARTHIGMVQNRGSRGYIYSAPKSGFF